MADAARKQREGRGGRPTGIIPPQPLRYIGPPAEVVESVFGFRTVDASVRAGMEHLTVEAHVTVQIADFEEGEVNGRVSFTATMYGDDGAMIGDPTEQSIRCASEEMPALAVAFSEAVRIARERHQGMALRSGTAHITDSGREALSAPALDDSDESGDADDDLPF